MKRISLELKRLKTKEINELLSFLNKKLIEYKNLDLSLEEKDLLISKSEVILESCRLELSSRLLVESIDGFLNKFENKRNNKEIKILIHDLTEIKSLLLYLK